MRSATELTEIFCEIDDPGVMKRFFLEIFTPAEIDDFVLRWRLLKMLHASVPQRKIAEKLGISLCKITRGAKVLKNRDSVALKILKDKIGDT